MSEFIAVHSKNFQSTEAEIAFVNVDSVACVAYCTDDECVLIVFNSPDIVPLAIRENMDQMRNLLPIKGSCTLKDGQ